MQEFDQSRKKGAAPAGAGLEGGQGQAGEVKRKILVVAKDDDFSVGVMEYALNLAERLGYDLIALNLEPHLEAPGGFFSLYQRLQRARFSRRARLAWQSIKPEVLGRGIRGEHVVKFAEVAEAVKDLNHRVKRIDFVIADEGVQEQEIAEDIPLPVFSLTGYQGERMMGREKKGKTKPWGKTFVFGALAAALYGALFWKSSTIMTYFTRGGWYAALPLATVFVFSFVHGAFANYLWSALGIEAMKRVQPRTEAPRPVQRQRPRPQLRLNA